VLELAEADAEWVHTLGTGSQDAYERLHALLLRIAFGELRRRGAAVGIDGPELDGLAHQAAADALVSIRRKLPGFRGESRFTTWAYKFVIFEVSSKVARHFWRVPRAAMQAEDWNQLPDRLGLDPTRESEWRELVSALRRAVNDVLTERQRSVFVALVLDEVPLDVLVNELGSTRNAVYKTLYDARRKLRAQLVAEGHLD
jgi:RNA polymerase sigma-70 factor, ECF subfamily